MTERRTGLLATLALLLITACWGSTFFLTKDLLERVPVLDYLAVRFAVATLALVVMFPRAVSRLSPAARQRGVVLGLLYGVAQILQTAGLEHTAATVSGPSKRIISSMRFAAQIPNASRSSAGAPISAAR